MSLDKFLTKHRVTIIEGYSQQLSQQVRDLIQLSKGCKSALEIGFNAGHSADLLLKHNPELQLVSFDLGEHLSVKKAKEYIDLTYPNRHTLILGDSTKTIPQYILQNAGKTFDFIFIDGGHRYPIPKLDLINCLSLANKNTIVALDDVIFNKSLSMWWTEGPARGWMECLSENKLVQADFHEYEKGRGMVWGKYITQIPYEEQCA